MDTWIDFVVRVPFYGRIRIEEGKGPVQMCKEIEAIVEIKAKSRGLNFRHAQFTLREFKTGIEEKKEA